MRIRRSFLWKFICAIVIAISSFTFTPIVLAPGVFHPAFLGLPRTLWIGIVIVFALIALTIVGGLVHPANDASSDRDEPRDNN